MNCNNNSINDRNINTNIESNSQLSSLKTNGKSKRIAFIGITVFGSSSLALLSVCLPFIFPAFRRIVLPYIPATDSQLNNILKVVKKSKPSTLIDLGSGDGRIV